MARGSRGTDIRIGHDARAAATGTLDIALREGRIDLAEYERRLVVILAAKVAEDLIPAITGLPSRPGERGPGLRVSAMDREQALVRLAEALADGRIEATEYAGAEDLLRRAVTYADVDAVVGNLDARASVAEREQAVERIEAAVAEGLLDPAERHGRIEAARKATTDAQLSALVAGLTTNTRSPALPARASNADREAVAARLHDALEAGFLDLTEFDERVRAVYAARLSSELTRLVADLPEPAPLPSEPPVEHPRREWRPGGRTIVGIYSCSCFVACVLFLAENGSGVVPALIVVVWLIGLVVLVKRGRRSVAADLPAEPAPREEDAHVEELPEEIQQRIERIGRITKQLDQMKKRADPMNKQLDQLPELMGQLPPKQAARLAKRFRQLQIQERGERIPIHFKQIADQLRQLPDQAEQAPPEVVERLSGRLADLMEYIEQIAEDVERLTKQVKQLL